VQHSIASVERTIVRLRCPNCRDYNDSMWHMQTLNTVAVCT